MRKIRNRRKNNTKIMFIISFIFIFIMSSAYAAFSTIIKISVEGELEEPETEYVYAVNSEILNVGTDASQIQEEDVIELNITQEQRYCAVKDENPDFSNANCAPSLEDCNENTQESPGEKWCIVAEQNNPFTGQTETYNGCEDEWYYDTQAECETELQTGITEGSFDENQSTCEKHRIPAIVCQNHTFYYENNDIYSFIRYGIKEEKIVSAEVGFLLDGEEHYMKGGDATYDSNSEQYNNDSQYYIENKTMLLQVFGERYCTISNEEIGSGGEPIPMNSDKQYKNIIPLNNTNAKFQKLATSGTYERISCNKDGINANADTKGLSVSSLNTGYPCQIESNGNSYCSGDSGGGVS